MKLIPVVISIVVFVCIRAFSEDTRAYNGNPVILLHGLGSSADEWKRNGFVDYLTSKGFRLGHIDLSHWEERVLEEYKKTNSPSADSNIYNESGSLFVISFSEPCTNVYAQETEVEEIVRKVIAVSGKEKVIIVGHSMGGLAARGYLTKHLDDHHVEKLVCMGTPNLGTIMSVILFYMPKPVKKFLDSIDVGNTPLRELWDWMAPINAGSPALEDMSSNSAYLKDLNSRKHPIDLQYVSIIGDMTDFEDTTTENNKKVSFELFRELEKTVLWILIARGDGTIPYESQDMNNVGIKSKSLVIRGYTYGRHYREMRAHDIIYDAILNRQ